MSKNNGTQASLADPSKLEPLDSDDKKLRRVVIETPRGSRGKKNKERNDGITAIEQAAHSLADVRTIDDLGKQFCRELEEFFRELP